MNRKTKIIVSVVGISIVLLALLGITYAYYLTRIEGNTNTNSISVSTADLKLKYSDGNGLIVKVDVMPGTVIEKTFTVTNEGNSKVNGYIIIFENLVNELSRKEDLVYKLECKLNDNTSCGEIIEKQFPSGKLSTEIIYSNNIEVGMTQNYTLTVSYINLIDKDQSIDMNSKFNAKINIKDGNFNPYITGTNIADENSLVYNIMKNQQKDGIETILNIKPITIPGKEISSMSQYKEKGIEPTTYQTTTNNYGYYIYGDDYIINQDGKFTLINPKYYHNTNNDFTPLKGKYIENYGGSKNPNNYSPYDGTIDLEKETFFNIYKVSLDTTSTTLSYGEVVKIEQEQKSLEKTLSITQDELGTSYYFRGTVQDNYVLFNNMCFRIVRIEGDGSTKLIYAGDVTNGATNCNEVGDNTGIIKNENNILTPEYGIINYYANYINFENGLEDTIENWFNEKFNTIELKNKIKEDKWCLGGNRDYKYNPQGILYAETPNFATNFVPFWIYQSDKRLVVDKTPSLNCEQENYVMSKYGTITADEVIFAGGGINAKNLNYYLIDNATNTSWWTLSVSYFTGTDEIFFVTPLGSLVEADIFEEYTPYGKAAVRPMITLIQDTTISGGNGTKNNPYIIN